jgi:hypothetical protein
MDFVIPLHRNNVLFQCTIEAIQLHYHPKTIHIITPSCEIEKLRAEIWVSESGNGNICFWDEETFFLRSGHENGLTRDAIEKWYSYIDSNSREFGWWFQQIIKLGALSCIPELSDPFMVWDSDLIPLEAWPIYPCFDLDGGSGSGDDQYRFALLQEKEKNEFNKRQYACSLFTLLGLVEITPQDKGSEVGTFVPHHFVFHHCVVSGLIERIESRNQSHSCWIESVMKLSQEYYRFSEYKSMATFMSVFFPKLLCYHEFEHYGKQGLRIRDEGDAREFVGWFSSHAVDGYMGLMEYLKESGLEISYLQVEHL